MRPIDADALIRTIRQHDYLVATMNNSIDAGMFTIGIQQAVDDQPTIDTYGTWIPCSEHLPYYAYWRDVCVTMKMYDTFVTRKVNWNGEEGRWEWGNGKPVKEQVIAWMPTPEPYREEKEDE